MTVPGANRRSGRRSFLALASLFLVPFAAALWLYYSTVWRPAPGAHGELIDPPRPLPAVALTLPDGRVTSPDVLRGAWFIIYLSDGPCTEGCTAALAELARVRAALGNDARRVQRVLLHADDCCAPGFPGPGDEDLLALGATGSAGQALFAVFPRVPDGAASIYIVDPRGNLMMRHAATGAAQGLLKDLERLLRLSTIG